jgi:hypothetical protein
METVEVRSARETVKRVSEETVVELAEASDIAVGAAEEFVDSSSSSSSEETVQPGGSGFQQSEETEEDDCDTRSEFTSRTIDEEVGFSVTTDYSRMGGGTEILNESSFDVVACLVNGSLMAIFSDGTTIDTRIRGARLQGEIKIPTEGSILVPGSGSKKIKFYNK